jgi:hypothetical protein
MLLCHFRGKGRFPEEWVKTLLCLELSLYPIVYVV